MAESRSTDRILRTQAMFLRAIPSILIGIDSDRKICQWNEAAEQILGLHETEALGKSISDLPLSWNASRLVSCLQQCLDESTPVRVDNFRFQRPDDSAGILGLTLTPFNNSENGDAVLILGADITEKQHLEAQLVQAQKLESIGQMAAGIAHEINTPTQYVGDNLRFLTRSFESFRPVLDCLVKSDWQGIRNAVVGIDLDFLLAEIPTALSESSEGIRRVADIVRAMKEFSHPGTEDKSAIDINAAIASTTTVARNEWKYVADLVLDLDSKMPSVPCVPGEFNQVILNLVVNAAHAIEDVVRNSGDKGLITMKTCYDDEFAEIKITDTGCGIPDHIIQRIFDPFFTTKEVGRGTGQGLAMVHSSIVKRHQGSIAVKSKPGEGTTFTVRIPLRLGNESEGAAVAA